VVAQALIMTVLARNSKKNMFFIVFSELFNIYIFVS
jgi:hypothetical protein